MKVSLREKELADSVINLQNQILRLREELRSSQSVQRGLTEMSLDYKIKYYDICRESELFEEALLQANERLVGAGLNPIEVPIAMPF